MEIFWKSIFYILNLAAYPFLFWWVVNNYLVTSMAAASVGYWIFFFVLIFLVVSTFSYFLAYFWGDNSYREMFFKNLGMFFSTLYIL